MKAEIFELLKELRSQIDNDFRASDDPDDNTPAMQVTFSTRDGQSWRYQTGDNSFTGACYGDPHWSFNTIGKHGTDEELQELANDIEAELLDLYAEDCAMQKHEALESEAMDEITRGDKS